MRTKIRKFLNIPDKSQSLEIQKGVEKLNELAENYAKIMNERDLKSTIEHNGICPNCSSKEIVNKITRVQGSGEVKGSFMYGVYGSSSTDTNEVNHCNNCGNQWKKRERNYSSRESILNLTYFFDIATVIQNKYKSLGKKTVDALKASDIPAESMWKVYKNTPKEQRFLFMEDYLTLSGLRKLFKSVYDK